MDLRQLRHFVVLAEELHFGHAAKRLFMTQPALSASVMRLEQDMDVRLFERSNKAVELTSIGLGLLPRAREILAMSERIRRYVLSVASGRAGVIEVGFTGTMLFRGLAKIFRQFSASFPEIDLSMRESTSQVQMDMLRTGRLDVGFLTTPVPPLGLSSFVFIEERFAACLPQDHRLAHKDDLEVGELRDEVFVMLERENSPTYHEFVLSLCTGVGFLPKSQIVAAQAASVFALVAAGLGIAVMPESIGWAQFPGVMFIPLRGQLARPSVYVAWRSDREVPGLDRFLEAIRQDAHGWVRDG
jgi:DNA-binding transcriptional LysR family regulator